jgi:hypothetical protein
MKQYSRLLPLVSFLLSAQGAAADSVSFNRDIRPLLSDNCFPCHGPDESKREAGLRLDVREEAVAQRDGVSAISPGQPAASELIKRINHDDPEARMPPADSERSLTSAQRHLLETWLAQGATYDVFPVGVKITPFSPWSPDGSRSYPASAHGQWQRPVESELHPRHQRRGAAVGQRRTVIARGVHVETPHPTGSQLQISLRPEFFA